MASCPMSPEGTKPRRGEVPRPGLMFTSGTMTEALYWLFQPGAIVMVAGFQNMDDSPPEPEAAPAKDSPCAMALCSRGAKAPATAPLFAATSAPSDTVASARERERERSRSLIGVVRPGLLFALSKQRRSTGILAMTGFRRNLAAPNSRAAYTSVMMKLSPALMHVRFERSVDLALHLGSIIEVFRG